MSMAWGSCRFRCVRDIQRMENIFSFTGNSLLARLFCMMVLCFWCGRSKLWKDKADIVELNVHHSQIT
jgi:hypothetical protein